MAPMNNIKAVIFTFLATITLIVLNCCKFHAEENVLPVDQSHSTSNGTVILLKNDTDGHTHELPIESSNEGEIEKDEDILKPTIAPATPVPPSSFILISSAEGMQSVVQSISLDSKDHLVGSNLNENQNERPRLKVESQIEEIEFDTDGTESSQKESELPVKTTEEGKEKIEVKDEEIMKFEEPSERVDLMKFNTNNGPDDSKGNNNINEELRSKEMGKKEEETDDVDKSRDVKDDDKVILNEEENTGVKDNIEKGASDKGILESFKDWKEKQETNGKNQGIEKTAAKPPLKKRVSKKTNYASNECGAKVVAANDKAENIAAILNENRDLYMLNPCSCSIWFVIELCEKVRAETIEMANFELFSSTPEKFNVYFSTRYPTREWEFGGTFNSKAERSVQSFHMAEEYYAKFVKIELLSHFGKEHYCPLSLVRVFGRSEVEELDDSEDSSHEHESISEDDEKIGEKDNREGPDDSNEQEGNNEKNFLKSATDIVIGFVNKATKSFTGAKEKGNDTENSESIVDISSKDRTDDAPKESSKENGKSDIVHFVTEKEEEPKELNELENEKNLSKKESSAETNTVSSKFVILLEGDDSDDDSESKHVLKNCVFNGEIQRKRCADPSKKLWVEHLFIHRMCPRIVYKRRKISYGDKITLNNRYESKKDINVIGKQSDSGTGEMFLGKTVQEAGEMATASSSQHDLVNISFTITSHTPSVSSHVSINGDKQPQSEGNPTTATKVEAVPKTIPELRNTELANQLPLKEKGSCDKKLPVQPDLSKLLESVDNFKTETSFIQLEDGSSLKTDNQDFAVKREANAVDPQKNNQENDKNNNNELVDVLVINYDQHHGEGKAESSKSQSSKSQSSKSQSSKSQSPKSQSPKSQSPKSQSAKSESSKSESSKSESSESESSESESNEEARQIQKGIVNHSVIDESNHSEKKYRKVREDVVAQDLEEDAKPPNSLGTVDGISEIKKSDSSNRLEEDLGLRKEPISEEREENKKDNTKLEDAASPKVQLNDSRAEEQKENRKSDASSLIEPSFSQPATVSFSSKKTNSDIDISSFSANTSNGDTLKLPVSPAPVLNDTPMSDMLTIRATEVPISMMPRAVDKILQEQSVDLKESSTAPTERLELQKKDTVQSQTETSMKIGSGSFGNNKESAILKLKSRVKELETNLSLSTQYLEEMSKRYGTALEDQQKQFKLKLNALNLTIIKNKEIMEKQEKSLDQLMNQVLLLTMQLKNLTDVAAEQNLKMAERYAFTCLVEAVIIIVLLWSCIRRPRYNQHPIDQRRHSAPSTYSHRFFDDQGRFASHQDANSVQDQRPSSNDHLPSMEIPIASNSAFASTARRRRPRKKSKNVDDSVFDGLDEYQPNNNKSTAMVSSTAGVLFSAGNKIFNGLTGAFSKQPKKAVTSRRTNALIDINGYENARVVGRSKSLETVEEAEEFLPPQRHQSFESLRSKKYTRMAVRLSDDKKRG